MRELVIIGGGAAGLAAAIAAYDAGIRDIIISGRKHELLTGLERDLIEDAKLRENFVIY